MPKQESAIQKALIEAHTHKLKEVGIRFWHEDLDGPRGTNPLTVTVYDAPDGTYNVRSQGTSPKGEAIDLTLNCPNIETARIAASTLLNDFQP